MHVLPIFFTRPCAGFLFHVAGAMDINPVEVALSETQLSDMPFSYI